ncbi:glycosyltransferase family protein [Candidatus Protochlamydia phocaeensis]|uniref:glycosyltransferase family protein n=1 Tax=Candidatus Protochlamydia phocaeensis TaxID=1414722 RepID=UPI000838F000|nr:glycosyltransferase [Candidatus Protochlamydia phocaeensis]
MKLQKVYLFASVSNQYGVIDNFIRELNNALNRQGVISRIIEAKRDDPRTFLNELLSDPPDCTLSFNGLLPDEEGRFLCDMIKIPHVACLTDAPNHFFQLVKSPLTIITCVDRNFCQVFRDFQCPHVIFLPHAASRTLSPDLTAALKYDVLMLNSFIDYEAIRQGWANKYSVALSDVLEEAAEMTLSDYQLPYMQAFIQTLDRHLRAGKPIDPRLIDYETLLDELEAYIGGRSRTELLMSIQDATVHVFGSQPEAGGWKKYLGNKSNIHLHPPVPFSEAINLMKQAKILLNSTPEIKQGAHERILSGLASGAAVLTLDTPYMREQFKDEEDILLYGPRDWEAVNHKINLYLNDENKRNNLVGKGREKVLQHHTWDQRAQTLIKELPPILEKIKAFLDAS